MRWKTRFRCQKSKSQNQQSDLGPLANNWILSFLRFCFFVVHTNTDFGILNTASPPALHLLKWDFGDMSGTGVCVLGYFVVLAVAVISTEVSK